MVADGYSQSHIGYVGGEDKDSFSNVIQKETELATKDTLCLSVPQPLVFQNPWQIKPRTHKFLSSTMAPCSSR